MSTKLPIYTKFNKSEKNYHEIFNKDLLSNKSYFSKTTSTFQLGIISEREWIGNEIRYFSEKPVPYSVIATKSMRVYSISKDDFMNKTPKDLLPYFDEISSHKSKWVCDRFIEIALNVNKLKDTYFEGINE